MPTNIEWTDETWNPVTGCTKVSQGCKNCYALREWSRLAANPKATAYFGREFTDVVVHPERLTTPLRWTKPRKVFVNSMSDLFHEDVSFDFIDQVFAVMALSPQHTFQVLTKRPQRMRDYMTFEGHGRWGYIDGRARQIYAAQRGRPFPPGKILLGPLPNVWLGVSVEDQATADERIPLLLQTPAAVRWISAEPLLGAVDLSALRLSGGVFDALRGGDVGRSSSVETWPALSWVVCGGESGPKARPMHPDWARSLRDQCAEAGVPFLFKQWGEHDLSYDRDRDDPDCRDCARMDRLPGRWINLAGGHGFNGQRVHYAHRTGKKAAGRLLDGALHDDYPVDGQHDWLD